MAAPVRPVKMLVIPRTRSMGTSVLPAVTRIFMTCPPGTSKADPPLLYRAPSWPFHLAAPVTAPCHVSRAQQKIAVPAPVGYNSSTTFRGRGWRTDLLPPPVVLNPALPRRRQTRRTLDISPPFLGFPSAQCRGGTLKSCRWRL